MKILLLTRFDSQGASSRLRFMQFLPHFELAGIECVVSPLFDNAMLAKKYRQGGYTWSDVLVAYWRRILALMRRQRLTLLWIEKEVLPWWPEWFEKWLLKSVPYVLDFDDAIFHNYDLHPFTWVRRVYGRRIDHLMAGARLVVCGNEYLGARAKAAGASWVEIIPTVVDISRYVAKQKYEASAKPCIVWIGSPSSVQYLLDLRGALADLARRVPFTLRVIGAGGVVMPGVDVESVVWTAETEAAAIVECDIGIMPLRDSPWEQGKCAYKLIQYMACGLPSVASSIGANRDVVVDGETGFFADTDPTWIEKLDLLIRDVELRQRLGQAGRARVEAKYSLQKIAPRLAHLLVEAEVQ